MRWFSDFKQIICFDVSDYVSDLNIYDAQTGQLQTSLSLYLQQPYMGYKIFVGIKVSGHCDAPYFEILGEKKIAIF